MSAVVDGPTTLVQNTLVLAGSAAVLFYVNWHLAVATLTVFPGMAIGTAIFRYYSGRAYRETRRRLAEVTGQLQEDISGVRVVQAFRREGTNYERFVDINDHYRAANVTTVNASAIYFPYVDLLSALAMAVVLGYGGTLVFNGDLTPGGLFVFIGLLSNFFDPVQQLSQFYQTFLAATAALDNIFTVLDTEPRLTDAPDARELPQIRGDVAFEDVHFSYAPGGTEVLHGVSFARAGGRDDRARRAHRRGQVDHREAARAVLRPDRRAHHDRRARPARRHDVDAPPAARDRAAGGLPLLRLGPRQHRVRPARRDRRRDPRCGAAVGAHEFIQRPPGRLRHRRPGARLAALDRPAPAGRVRPRAPGRPADPDPRRGDVVGRHPDRGRASRRRSRRCCATVRRSSSRTGSRRSAGPT